MMCVSNGDAIEIVPGFPMAQKPVTQDEFGEMVSESISQASTHGVLPSCFGDDQEHMIEESDDELAEESDEEFEAAIRKQRAHCMEELPSMSEILESESAEEVAECLEGLDADVISSVLSAMCSGPTFQDVLRIQGRQGIQAPSSGFDQHDSSVPAEESEEELEAAIRKQRVHCMGELPSMSEILESESAEEVAECLEGLDADVISSVLSAMRSGPTFQDVLRIQGRQCI